MSEIIKYDTYGEILINSPKHGEFKIKIDLDDVERCEEHTWSINKIASNKGRHEKIYAVSKGGGLLHRFITNAPKGKFVDHINGVTTDNQKNNLRICDNTENIRNSTVGINNTSGHTGICWFKKTNKWLAHIMVDRKKKHLGYFASIEDAINARKKAEERYFGEFRKIKSR